MGRNIVAQLQSENPKQHLHSKSTNGKTSLNDAFAVVDDIHKNRTKKGLPQDAEFQRALVKRLQAAKEWLLTVSRSKDYLPKEGNNHREEFKMGKTTYRVDIEFHGFGKEIWAG